MKYKYLEKWITENKDQNQIFYVIKKFEDQYAIFFKRNQNFLQINLASEDTFCFFTNRKELPFSSFPLLYNFNTHLKNALLENIKISNSDRIILFHFSKIDIYNQKIHYKLIIELIPHYQNIILTKSVYQKNLWKEYIIECLKKISFSENRYRQILPGIEYNSPLSEYINQKEKIPSHLNIDANGKITENKEEQTNFNNMNQLFDSIYYNHIFPKRIERLRRQKILRLEKQIVKKEKKILNLKKELLSAKEEEKWKQWAELLKANYSSIKLGLDSITVINYYKDNFPKIVIPLFPQKNAEQNINYYFKKYKKSKKGKKIIAEQIDFTQIEIKKLEKKISEIEKTNFLKLEKTRITKTKKTENSNLRNL